MKTFKEKIRQSPVKTWIDKSVIGIGINPESPAIADGLRSKSRYKINPKDTEHKFLYKVRPITRLQNEIANTQSLDQLIEKGFRPRWYVVFHLHHPPFGFDDPKFEKNLKVMRDNLFGIVYGSNWSRRIRRARAVFGVELGKKRDRPHVNLLIEDLPSQFDFLPLVEHLFNTQLPNKVRCVWRKSADVQEVYSKGIHGYISKENNHEFSSINPFISDTIK
tara:strand:- start:2937 stop:3596 length:660 start_codon:yes stop_codon:yes gene_type:complete